MSLEDDQKNLRTRCGYIPSECIQMFEKNLMDSGGVAIGKSLHFGIDLICSGGYMSFFKIIWNYSLNHINIGSLRIFMYLKKRMSELDELIKIYPDETLYNNLDFQSKIAEIILVLHDAPKFPKLVWPKVGSETHDETWIKSITVSTETDIINRVWKREGDLSILKIIGNNICNSLSEHSLERALFWMKWGFEEESKAKKENSKASLSTIDRGNGGKTKNDIGYFYLELFVEYYKELARKDQIRMNEEFLAIVQLFRNQDSRITNSFKKNLLGLCARILCEVPRWKVPAASPLIKDPLVLSRTVSQSPKFFVEILKYPSVTSKNLEKMLKNKGKIEKKGSKKITMEEQFAAFDAAMEKYMMK
jgi:hypothetical protein